MLKRIFINLVAGFVVFPIVYSLRYLSNFLDRDYQLNYLVYPDFASFLLAAVQKSLNYPLVPLIFTVLILFPFEIIKYIAIRKSIVFSFWKKFLVLTGISLFWMFLMAITYTPLFLPSYSQMLFQYTVTFIAMMFLMNLFLHYTDTIYRKSNEEEAS
ncbi:hypothetical protein ACFSQW_12630 [Sphingobacterium tabacisoli]|uniref:DUF2975 domain-containing protein n=1 Tax=Sphingobacterium tabacisoli TaxID=2044855 RepID=A0ABW5L2K1_9SPHI